MNTGFVGSCTGSFWTALEAIPALTAVPALWRRHLGEAYQIVHSAFLKAAPEPVHSYPCPRECGCWHEVLTRDETARLPARPIACPASASATPPSPPAFVAVCRCDSWNCDDLLLTLEDITPLELNRAKFARAICDALGLHGKSGQLNLPNCEQIGAWSCDAVPVFLTIQPDARRLCACVSELSLRLGRPFILLAPTAESFDARCQELLNTARSGFFALDATVALAAQGLLLPRQPPGQLFARFTPEPTGALEEDVAQRAFALVKALDCENLVKPPGLLTVFRLYCQENLTAAQIARRCHSSKPTIVRRLQAIKERIGTDPRILRRLSAHMATVDDALADPRARHIQPRQLLQEEPETDC